MNPDFLSPNITNETVLSFELTVNDGVFTSEADQVKITIIPLLGMNNREKDEVKISPNPSNGQFKSIYFDESNEPVKVEIHSIAGELLYKSILQQSENIDFSRQAKGISLVKTIKNNRVTTLKLINH